ncbi:MAG: hypothetical protein QXS03_01440 [Candidatus Micrarchaeaceae archaeon]
MKLTRYSIDKEAVEVAVLIIFSAVLIALIANLSKPLYCPRFIFKNGTSIPTFTINISHLSWTYPVASTKLTLAQSKNITEMIC